MRQTTVSPTPMISDEALSISLPPFFQAGKYYPEELIWSYFIQVSNGRKWPF